MSWIKYDSTRADWINRGDTIRLGSITLTISSVDDTIDLDNVLLTGQDEYDDDVEIIVPCDRDVALVYWNYEE